MSDVSTSSNVVLQFLKKEKKRSNNKKRFGKSNNGISTNNTAKLHNNGNYDEEKLPMYNLGKKKSNTSEQPVHAPAYFLSQNSRKSGYGNPRIKAETADTQENLYHIFLNADSWSPTGLLNYNDEGQRGTALNSVMYICTIYSLQMLQLQNYH